MILYLMRHGIAKNRADPDCPPDPERALTERGIERTRAAAMGLKALGIAPGIILSSPYVRAMQTAEIAAKALGAKSNRIIQTDALLPLADPGMLCQELASRKEEAVLCAGHAPQVDSAVSRLLGVREPLTAMKKAGVVCLAVDFSGPAAGTILWSAPPRMLRQLAK